MQNDEILEAVGDDDWRPTARDIRMLNQGRKPAWAKKVTEIGPRKAKPRTSTSPSELAMRRVTEPEYRKPFSETDLKNAREGEELMNARIAHRIQKAFDDFTVSISADEISVNTPTVRFKVIPYGFVYKVKTIYSATRSEMEDCDSLYQVIELIKKNSQNIGECMEINEAKQILTKAGMLLSEKAALQLDTEYIDHKIAVLQKTKEKLVPIGKEVAAALAKNGITPSEFYIGPSEDSGNCILCIGMPRNKWYTIEVYDDGIEINVDGNYTITTTKEEYLPKLLKALNPKKKK